ncbi:relaxin-3 receptor 1-like [Heptranchias perlo]|uniref:relaxin-3 receptor 1-like n=1 Tax=Heptranchias perlo TaxID=212740 RepID=UPI00355A55AE
MSEMLSDWFLDYDANDSYWEEKNSTVPLELGDIGALGASYTVLRIVIVLTYSFVCAVGLFGNLLVLYLIRGVKGQNKFTINFFVFNLALTDFHFVLVLPFWAAEVALDHSWPFGNAICKLVLFITVLNMYTSVFFLTAMSVSRYCSVVQTLRPGRTSLRPCMVKWVSLMIWLVAVAASLPPAIYSRTINIQGEELCIQKFPGQEYWLALYHVQKIIVAFIIPLIVISVCYLLLLNFLWHHNLSSNNPRRQSKVTKSIIILVLSFFLCWLPNHAITFWGVLVKLELAHWDKAYYITHTYIHPLTICLANTNSCLNPIIYCLMRKEFRKSLKNLFWRASSISYPWMYLSSSCYKDQNEDSQVAIPLNQMDSKPESKVHSQKCDTLPATTTSVYKETDRHFPPKPGHPGDVDYI